MASVKNLKKDVNLLTDEVIGTCLMHQFANQKQNQEKADNLIDEMLVSRDEIINKINNPDIAKGKSVKAYYDEIFEEFLTKVNSIFETLGNMEE